MNREKALELIERASMQSDVQLKEHQVGDHELVGAMRRSIGRALERFDGLSSQIVNGEPPVDGLQAKAVLELWVASIVQIAAAGLKMLEMVPLSDEFADAAQLMAIGRRGES